LGRAVYALFRQSRLPNRVQVVDDGSKTDYHDVREYWLEHCPESVDFSWYRTLTLENTRPSTNVNGDNADVFVTLDTDTLLARDAIAEGIKPFACPRVIPVAGIELAWNYGNSLLARLIGVNALIWQFATCSAQSAAGDAVTFLKIKHYYWQV
jgi:hyaluronan synthase